MKFLLYFRYPRPERLDVYRGKVYIHPQNSQYDPAQGDWIWDPLTQENLESLKPPVDSRKYVSVRANLHVCTSWYFSILPAYSTTKTRTPHFRFGGQSFVSPGHHAHW